MKSLLRWAELVAPYLAGAVFWVAAAAKVWALPDWEPYLLRGASGACEGQGTALGFACERHSY